MRVEEIEKAIIFEGIVGSHLYGTATKGSDVDYRGVCIPSLRMEHNPFEEFEQYEDRWHEDRVIYGLKKFVVLCANSNPNIIEMLFIPSNRIIKNTFAWHYLTVGRKYFLSKKASKTFMGYAISQLKKMQLHRQWFVEPPTHKPTRKEFGLTDTPLINLANLEAILNVPPEILDKDSRKELCREKEYLSAKKKWENYRAWEEGRNPARKELEEKYKYDTKGASHLFRLLTEGKELLLTGNITFPLPNCQEILDIRNGSLTYEQVIFRAEQLIKEFSIWESDSVLPESPDYRSITSLYQYIVEEWYDSNDQ